MPDKLIDVEIRPKGRFFLMTPTGNGSGECGGVSRALLAGK